MPATLGERAGVIGAALLGLAHLDARTLGVRVGLTLPSFVEDPATPLAVARAAEDAGIHGVFAFDHLFRTSAAGALRPALECTALLGALATATRRIAHRHARRPGDAASPGDARRRARHRAAHRRPAPARRRRRR